MSSLFTGIVFNFHFHVHSSEKKFICILSVSLDFFPDLLFYTKIAFRFLEKEILGIAVLQSNGVTNIITVFKSYKHVSRTFLEMFNANEFFAELCTWK